MVSQPLHDIAIVAEVAGKGGLPAAHVPAVRGAGGKVDRQASAQKLRASGFSYRRIAETLGVPYARVTRWLSGAEDEGLAARRATAIPGTIAWPPPTPPPTPAPAAAPAAAPAPVLLVRPSAHPVAAARAMVDAEALEAVRAQLGRLDGLARDLVARLDRLEALTQAALQDDMRHGTARLEREIAELRTLVQAMTEREAPPAPPGRATTLVARLTARRGTRAD